MHLNALASHTMHLAFIHGIYNTLLIMHSILGNMCIILLEQNNQAKYA